MTFKVLLKLNFLELRRLQLVYFSYNEHKGLNEMAVFQKLQIQSDQLRMFEAGTILVLGLRRALFMVNHNCFVVVNFELDC